MFPGLPNFNGNGESFTLVLVVGLVFAAVHIALCYAVGKYGESKRQSFWLGFLLSMFASVVVGFVAVLAMGNRTTIER